MSISEEKRDFVREFEEMASVLFSCKINLRLLVAQLLRREPAKMHDFEKRTEVCFENLKKMPYSPGDIFMKWAMINTKYYHFVKALQA